MFYMTQPYEDNHYRFKSARDECYLILANDESEPQAKTLKCGTPSNDNDVFERSIVHLDVQLFKQVNDGIDCYLAFDEVGEPVAPCDPSLGSENKAQVYFIISNY